EHEGHGTLTFAPAPFTDRSPGSRYGPNCPRDLSSPWSNRHISRGAGRPRCPAPADEPETRLSRPSVATDTVVPRQPVAVPLRGEGPRGPGVGHLPPSRRWRRTVQVAESPG